MTVNDKLDEQNIKTHKTNYAINISFNQVTENEIKYFKSTNNIVYNVNIIYYTTIDGLYKLIGCEYNNNVYYVYNRKKDIKEYKTITNYNNGQFIIDKLTISEIIKKSFKYYMRYYNTHNNNEILLLYEQHYKKKYNNYSYYYNYPLEYTSLYQSSLLSFNIYDKTLNTTKECTFLPVNKKSCCNLYMAYQYVFIVLKLNNNKTFTNPKNKIFFGNNIKLVSTNYILKPRLYVSKYNIHDTIYYIKCTEKDNYNIAFILDKPTEKIIGVMYNKTEYYIWKNNGDITLYETYNEKKNYHEFILNTFKDALLFLFKIY